MNFQKNREKTDSYANSQSKWSTAFQQVGNDIDFGFEVIGSLINNKKTQKIAKDTGELIKESDVYKYTSKKINKISEDIGDIKNEATHSINEYLDKNPKVKQTVETISSTVNEASDIIGNTVDKGLDYAKEEIDEFTKEHPEATRNIKATGKILELVPASKLGKLNKLMPVHVPKDIPKIVIRQDNDFLSKINEKGHLKAYRDKHGNLIPPNKDGKGSIQSQVRGGNSKNSPYISTTDLNGIKNPKYYGKNVIQIDTRKLQKDIQKGKVKDVEIISPKKVQEELQNKIEQAKDKYKKNPTSDNKRRIKRAEKDLENAIRDNECLIKGCVPNKYIKETTHKKVDIKK